MLDEFEEFWIIQLQHAIEQREVREGDLVIVEPWEFQGDEKGDVILKYRRNQVDYLKKKGYLRMLDEFEEF